MTEANHNRYLLPFIIAAYVVLTALVIAAVPINQAPDEGAHLEYIEHLASGRGLPVFEAKGANAPGYEFHQPPLYYAAAAPLWKILPANVQLYSARFLSLLCGALTLFLLWHSVRLLFPDNRVLASLATGFAALWPLHIGVGASGGNDAAAGLMCAGIFWSMARLLQRVRFGEYSWRDAALVGVFFGLGMLTKSTALVVGAAGVGAVFHFGWRIRKPLAFGSAAVVIGVALVICGWWLARNTLLYGDPLAAQIFDEAFRNSSPRPQAVMAATGVTFFEYLRALLIILFATCWGFFGGPNSAITMLNPFGLRGPRFEAFNALPVMLVFFLVTVLTGWGFLKWKLAELRLRALSPETRIMLFWWGLGFFLVVLALIRFNFMYLQAQARYLHPALLPMCLVFALGWLRLLGEGRALRVFAIFFGSLLVLLTLWNAFGWQTLV